MSSVALTFVCVVLAIAFSMILCFLTDRKRLMLGLLLYFIILISLVVFEHILTGV